MLYPPKVRKEKERKRLNVILGIVYEYMRIRSSKQLKPSVTTFYYYYYYLSSIAS